MYCAHSYHWIGLQAWWCNVIPFLTLVNLRVLPLDTHTVGIGQTQVLFLFDAFSEQGFKAHLSFLEQ